ncbi:hypothetical protein ACHAXS_005364 [Conticribra weissflogii]
MLRSNRLGAFREGYLAGVLRSEDDAGYFNRTAPDVLGMVVKNMFGDGGSEISFLPVTDDDDDDANGSDDGIDDSENDDDNDVDDDDENDDASSANDDEVGGDDVGFSRDIHRDTNRTNLVTTSKSPSLMFGSEGRTIHGYRLPLPPFQPVVHTSHTCYTKSLGGKSTGWVHFSTAVPHLILIGAQKSGTSTLQEIFDKEPNIIKPSYKRPFETHFFDFDMGLRSNDAHLKKYTEDELCAYRKIYSEYFNLPSIQTNVSVVFEKTPSYIVYPTIPRYLDKLCTWKPKILAILRNPVSRAWSQFQMEHNNPKRNKWPDPQIFIASVDGEIKQFVKHGLLKGPYIDRSEDNRVGTLSLSQFIQRNTTTFPFRFQNATLTQYADLVEKYQGRRKGDLFRGLYAPLLLPWVKSFAAEDRLMVLRFEPFVAEESDGNRTTVNRVLGFAGLVVNDTAYNHHRGNGTIHSRRRRLEKRRDRKVTVQMNSNTTLRQSMRGLNRKRSRRRLVWKLKRVYDPMPAKIREYLTMLFQPFNDFLPELLGEEWRNVW